MSGRRGPTSVGAARLNTLRDDRSTAEIRESICDRLGSDPLPSRLSRGTIVESIGRLAHSNVARATAASIDEPQLRVWLAELCEFEFDPRAERGLNYRRDELLQIDQTLAAYCDGGADR